MKWQSLLSRRSKEISKEIGWWTARSRMIGTRCKGDEQNALGFCLKPLNPAFPNPRNQIQHQPPSQYPHTGRQCGQQTVRQKKRGYSLRIVGVQIPRGLPQYPRYPMGIRCHCHSPCKTGGSRWQIQRFPPVWPTAEREGCQCRRCAHAQQQYRRHRPPRVVVEPHRVEAVFQAKIPLMQPSS